MSKSKPSLKKDLDGLHARQIEVMQAIRRAHDMTLLAVRESFSKIDAERHRQTGLAISSAIHLMQQCVHEASVILGGRSSTDVALLRELQAAHQIIRNGLAVMTTEQKMEWSSLNERDGAAGEGITRANER